MGIDRNSGIWDLETAKKRHRYDPGLAGCITRLYGSVKSVADLGCGLGDYCKYLKEHGIPLVHGYEGTPDIKEIAVYDDIMVLDLSKRRWVGINYELVLAIEVGEHLPVEHEETFINNVLEFTKKDLVLSWAIPGQGGEGHFNEQSNEYIIAKFMGAGLRFERKRTWALRQASTLRWFKNTAMAFRR